LPIRIHSPASRCRPKRHRQRSPQARPCPSPNRTRITGSSPTLPVQAPIAITPTVIVEFGRVGTKGQRVVKTFDDEERAKRGAVKLTLEKTRKGYQEG
jgi:hypothetical protein